MAYDCYVGDKLTKDIYFETTNITRVHKGTDLVWKKDTGTYTLNIKFTGNYRILFVGNGGGNASSANFALSAYDGTKTGYGAGIGSKYQGGNVYGYDGYVKLKYIRARK